MREGQAVLPTEPEVPRQPPAALQAGPEPEPERAQERPSPERERFGRRAYPYPGPAASSTAQAASSTARAAPSEGPERAQGQALILPVPAVSSRVRPARSGLPVQRPASTSVVRARVSEPARQALPFGEFGQMPMRQCQNP